MTVKWMDKLVIRGGRALSQSIEVSGAKNSALPLIVLSLLTPCELRLDNVPCLVDVDVLVSLLETLGASVFWDRPNRRLILQADNIQSYEASYDTVSRMRATFWVLGPLLARFGRARVSLPGGCAIGSRPVDIYIKGLRKMGAVITIDGGYVIAKTTGSQLKGCCMRLSYPSVGATHVLMMAASLARGETVIDNAAMEPEVVDVGTCLTKMGVQIAGLGTKKIVIQGTTSLHKTCHRVIPDRIEAGTYAVAAAITYGDLKLYDAPTHLMGASLSLLREAGVGVEIAKDYLRIFSKNNSIYAIDFTTETYPGFPTDLQAQFMALMTLADGTSNICEKIFENRFMHVQELIRLGADITLHGEYAVVRGVPLLKGAEVMASDLRASAALVLAGLAAKGETTMNRLYHLDRGFENLEKKLNQCGASVMRI